MSGLFEGKTLLIILNTVFLLIVNFVPSLKEVLTLELQASIAATITGLGLVYLKLKERQ